MATIVAVRSKPVAAAQCPRVSVVVPHFNYGEYLPMAVGSVLSQADVDVDVIIVDDASTDGSAEIARSLAATDDRVTLIEHPVNKRHIATYNDGLAEATGDYVVLLSADDALAPGSLARSTSLMEANPEVGMVYGNVQTFSDKVPAETGPQPAWKGAEASWTVWPGREWIELVGRQGRNLIANPEVVMRREVLEQAGGYDARFPHSADLYLWLQAAAIADIGRVNGIVQAYYRVHETNMHSIEFGGLLDDYEAVRDTFEAFYVAEGHRLRGVETLRALTRRALSHEAIRRSVMVSPDGAASLFRFSAETDPADELMRGFYRTCERLGIRGILRRVEDLRWKVRYQRELRRGV